MPTPDDYQRALHLMTRGRKHRVTKGAEIREEEDPDHGHAGAWVPIEVWVTAEEVQQVARLEVLAAEQRAWEAKQRILRWDDEEA